MIIIVAVYIVKNANRFVKLAKLEMISSTLHGIRMMIDASLCIMVGMENLMYISGGYDKE